ncbi:ankyrin repeat domain-containing protein [bacterium]|nr:ankyrin repeat domain-containing protein [bacterium]
MFYEFLWMIFNFLFLSTKEQNMQYSDIKKIFAKPPEQRTEEECKLLAKAYTEECCSNGNTALINAICDKDTKIALALIDAGADINAIDNFGNPALIHACLWGDKNVTSAFIAAGAIIDARNKYDQTALMHAASTGHTDTALALIAKGADIKATNKSYTDLVSDLIATHLVEKIPAKVRPVR